MTNLTSTSAGSVMRALQVTAVLVGAALGVPADARADDDGLVIGAVIPLTGTYGSYGAGLSAAMNIAVAEVNAAGGVLGQPVTLVIEDDQTDPTAGLNAAKKLVSVDGVDAIVGTFASSVTLPILSFTVKAEIPVLTVSGAPEISVIGRDTGLAYRFVSTEGVFGAGYALAAREEGLGRAYVLAGNNAAQLDAAEKFAERFAAEGGEVLGTTIFEPNQPNYRSEATKAIAARPDVVMLAAYTNDAITLAKLLYQLDPELTLVGPLYALGDDFIAAVGEEVADGTLAVDAMSAEEGAAYQRLAPLYEAAVGSSPAGNPYAVMDYDMIITLALAAEAAGSTDPKDFVPFIARVANAPGVEVGSYAQGLAALKAGEDIAYSGASSPVDFDENGDLMSMFFHTYRLDGGKAHVTGVIQP